jgi:hypothetical protein
VSEYVFPPGNTWMSYRPVTHAEYSTVEREYALEPANAYIRVDCDLSSIDRTYQFGRTLLQNFASTAHSPNTDIYH